MNLKRKIILTSRILLVPATLSASLHTHGNSRNNFHRLDNNQSLSTHEVVDSLPDNPPTERFLKPRVIVPYQSHVSSKPFINHNYEGELRTDLEQGFKSFLMGPKANQSALLFDLKSNYILNLDSFIKDVVSLYINNELETGSASYEVDTSPDITSRPVSFQTLSKELTSNNNLAQILHESATKLKDQRKNLHRANIWDYNNPLKDTIFGSMIQFGINTERYLFTQEINNRDAKNAFAQADFAAYIRQNHPWSFENMAFQTQNAGFQAYDSFNEFSNSISNKAKDIKNAAVKSSIRAGNFLNNKTKSLLGTASEKAKNTVSAMGNAAVNAAAKAGNFIKEQSVNAYNAASERISDIYATNETYSQENKGETNMDNISTSAVSTTANFHSIDSSDISSAVSTSVNFHNQDQDHVPSATVSMPESNDSEHNIAFSLPSNNSSRNFEQTNSIRNFTENTSISESMPSESIPSFSHASTHNLQTSNNFNSSTNNISTSSDTNTSNNTGWVSSIGSNIGSTISNAANKATSILNPFSWFRR